MFKETLGVLGSTLVGAVKQTASEYKPTAKNMGGAFTRVAEQGIANLSYRSPILADVAATMLHSFQHELIRRDKVKQFAKSDAATSFRDDLKKQMGKKTTDEEANKEMFKVIERLNKIVGEQGDMAKNDDFFKKNQKLFEEFKKSQTEPEAAKPQGGSGGDAGPMLERIEANTHKTVDLLAGMNEGDGRPGTPSEAPQGKTPNASFIDPYTGMPSMRAAIGGIGGSFLAKVFDEDTITKYADKTREKLFGKKDKSENPSIEPKASKKDEISDLTAPEVKVKVMKSEKKEPSVASILGDLSLDLAAPKEPDTSTPSESSREEDSKQERRSSSSIKLQEQMVEELKKLNESAKNNKDGDITETLKSLSGMVGGLGPILTSLAPLAKLAASVGVMIAAANVFDTALGKLGVGGNEIDTKQDDKNWDKMNWWQKAESGLARGIENTGEFIGLDNISNEAKSKRIAAETEYLSAKTGKDTSSNIGKMQEQKKEAERAERTAQQQAPVVAPINNTTNNNSNTTIVAPSSPRNQDSTFDKVQQSNIWGRVA